MLSQLRVHLVAPFHHVSLSPQQPVVCLPGLPLRNINSAILSQILLLECRPYLPYLSLSELPALPLYRLAGPLPQLRPILEFCLRGTAALTAAGQ